MGYQASNIGTIPANGFNWYIVFVEAEFNDDLRKEIENHFSALGKEVGENVLVVRGYDAKEFRQPFSEASALFEERWSVRIDLPALLIMNRPPVEVMDSAIDLDTTKVICFPLRPIYERHRTVVPFLQELCQALQNPQALEVLDEINPSGVKKFWEWLTKYVEIKPGAFGVSVDLGKAISDL